MKKIRLSIIVPIYNAEKYLEQCLKSILTQSFKDFELILVNDGSTDNSLKIIKNFQKNYDNIKLINQKNQGVIQARINGYKATTGEYIGWVDADDFIDCNMYSKMFEYIEKEHVDIVSCNYNFYPSNFKNKIKWYKPYQGVVDWKFINRNTVQWNKIVKRELLEKIDVCNLFAEIGEAAYTIALISAKSIVTIDEPLYYYRVGHSSLSTNYKNVSWYEQGVIKQIKKRNLIKDSELEEKWGTFFEYLTIYHYILLLLVLSYNDEKKLYKKYKKELLKLNYRKNEYIDIVLRENNGIIKALILKNVVPNSYFFTKIITKILFSRK